MAHRNAVLRPFAADMLQGLGNHFLHQLGLGVQLHAAFLDPGHRQQILHQIVKPRRIIVDVTVHLISGLWGQAFAVGQQHAGVAGDRGQRRSKVMGNGTQQIGAEFFILSQQLSLLLLPGVAHIFQRQRALSQYRQQDTVFKGFQGFRAFHDHAAVNLSSRFDQVDGGIPLPAGGDAGMHRQRSVRQLMQLGLGRPEDFLLRCSLLQHLIGLEQQVGSVGCPGGLLDLAFETVRQGAHNQRRHDHDKKGHRRAILVNPQGKARTGKEEVKHHHAAQRGQNIAAAGRSDHGSQQHRQQIYCDDICLGKAHP